MKDKSQVTEQVSGPTKRAMQGLFTNFLKGLLILAPLVVTFYAIYIVFITIDGLLMLPVPGLGFILAVVFIISIGTMASNIFFGRIFVYMENAVTRLPLVKLLYFSIKDLIGAFVGEKKSFSQPVVVNLSSDGGIKALGFVTREWMDFPGTEDYVAVYLPQSYNFAANLILVPRGSVVPIPGENSAKIMAFIVSGGVSSGTPPAA